MATKDPEKIKAAQRRYRTRKHTEKFGPEAGDMRGRHGNQARGSANGRWNDLGVGKNEDGYIKVRVGRMHPLADPNGYTYLHLLVWVSAGNPLPNSAETLHHKDEDKGNNRIDNLEILTRSDHARLHCEQRGRDIAGRFPKIREFPA